MLEPEGQAGLVLSQPEQQVVVSGNSDQTARRDTMAKIQCEVCGGSSLIKKEDRFVCEDCGISYSLEAVQREAF